MAIIKKSGGVMSTTPRPSEAAKEAAKDAPQGPFNKKFIVTNFKNNFNTIAIVVYYKIINFII